MVAITLVNGQVVNLNDTDIILVAGPYPHDVGPHTYVHTTLPAVLVTRESAGQLAGRLNVTPALAQLTRPDMTPVWIKGAAVVAVREAASNRGRRLAVRRDCSSGPA